MDKVIFYTMILSGIIFGWMIYLHNQRDVEPAWSPKYVEPARPTLGSVLRQSEAWVFLMALGLAMSITRL
ncbi:hypothetical protein NXS98_17515 [Fontisphaera persica]|uniref:hypothetical protein n=1 Tax=Fontisphaera persica TaxID=2974023 RepID=UPI0024BFD09D|nr:hypothetical protein [Fontisphaera persica]WCJ59490.1 hypothetical protein NXS98_17515 [Fontisphaera persica]